MDLYQASNQWATRPADERFWTLEEARDFAHQIKQSALVTEPLPASSLIVEADRGDGEQLCLTLPGDLSLPLTHYAFGQLCSRTQMSASTMRRLPAPLAAQVLNYGLETLDEQGGQVSLLVHDDNGSSVVRCMSSQLYNRVWDADLLERAIDLRDEWGWKTPPARPAADGAPTRQATAADVLKTSLVQVGDLISPAGIYVSDHDLFLFMVDDERQVQASQHEALARGFFLSNSEVGDRKLSLTTFLYSYICGNHIVWGASGVQTFSMRHVGQRVDNFREEVGEAVAAWMETAALPDESFIRRAKAQELGESKSEVVDYLFNRRGLAIGKALAGRAYDAAEEYEDIHGSPRSVWGMASGLTRVSQGAFADERETIDAAAGRLLEMVN